MRLLLAAIMCLGVASHALAAARTITMKEPRPFGHFVGDVLERRAEISAEPGDELLSASLPNAGPLTYWLDLIGIDVSAGEKDGRKTYRLDLKYQTFYVPLEPRRMTIPPLTLKFKAASGAANVTIPPFSFTISPLRELIPEKGEDGSPLVLRPDIAPRAIKTGGLRTAMLASTAVAALTLALIAYHNAWGPFRRRARRPFTEAARLIRSTASANGGGAGYRRGLMALHRAFDEAAGRRLLAEDLDRFLATHPSLDADRKDIARFFESSRSVFFADDVSAGIAQFPPSALSSLATRLATAERSAS